MSGGRSVSIVLDDAADRRRRLAAALRKSTDKLSAAVSLDFVGNPFRDLNRRLIVASSGARVGSHLLSQGLLAHGVNVNEYFDPGVIVKTCRRLSLPSVVAYCEYRLKRVAGNGLFGVKGRVHVMTPLLLAGELPEHFAAWPIVYLYRADVVRQAISLFKARLTGSWRSAHLPSRPLTDDDYEGERIKKVILRIFQFERAWEEVFTGFNLTPMRLAYETLAERPRDMSRRVAKFAGFAGKPIKSAAPPLAPQADALNDRWRDRFMRDFPDFDFTGGSPGRKRSDTWNP